MTDGPGFNPSVGAIFLCGCACPPAWSYLMISDETHWHGSEEPTGTIQTSPSTRLSTRTEVPILKELEHSPDLTCSGIKLAPTPCSFLSNYLVKSLQRFLMAAHEIEFDYGLGVSS